MAAENSNKSKLKTYTRTRKTLFIQELQPALNANVSSEKLLLY